MGDDLENNTNGSSGCTARLPPDSRPGNPHRSEREKGVGSGATNNTNSGGSGDSTNAPNNVNNSSNSNSHSTDNNDPNALNNSLSSKSGGESGSKPASKDSAETEPASAVNRLGNHSQARSSSRRSRQCEGETGGCERAKCGDTKCNHNDGECDNCKTKSSSKMSPSTPTACNNNNSNIISTPTNTSNTDGDNNNNNSSRRSSATPTNHNNYYLSPPLTPTTPTSDVSEDVLEALVDVDPGLQSARWLRIHTVDRKTSFHSRMGKRKLSIKL